MRKLTYITDLACQPGGGGSYAVNWHTQDQLRKHFDLNTPPPIVPKVSQWEQLLSRVQRHILKRPSRFSYFSPVTLDSNAKRASRYYENGSDGVFFRSATRWCHCKPHVPYFVYLDIVFRTFFENTFKPLDFLADDLERIYRAEARFLENADAVFFESDWGMQRAGEAYSLSSDHYVVANRGGVLEPPVEDTWSTGPPKLLSIAMNFEQKGGDIILQAYKQLQVTHPDLQWHIVGGKPSGDWESIDGIIYEGVLNPDIEQDLVRYRTLLSQAILLLHPTREDTNPLVLTEAAYFGCPSISVKRFAIPELVVDGKTGVLLDWPVEPGDLAQAVSRLIASPDVYRSMRRAAREFSCANFDWDKTGSQMAQAIEAALV